jgi:hypothetical protein
MSQGGRVVDNGGGCVIDVIAVVMDVAMVMVVVMVVVQWCL